MSIWMHVKGIHNVCVNVFQSVCSIGVCKYVYRGMAM